MPYMGRPRVLRSELLKAGASHDEIRSFSLSNVLSDAISLTPLGCNWPMGFSWSSAVAQETLLGIANDSGLTSEYVWATDKPLPSDWSLGFAVATDDMMIFSDSGPGITLGPTADFERGLLRHGAVKHPDKDLDDQLDATCLGIDLVRGTHWHAPGLRLIKLLRGVVSLADHKRSSPGAVAGYLGVTQWFCLLRRLRLCVFDTIYHFCSGARARDWKVVECPQSVLTELLVDACLFPFGAIDMTLPFLPFIGATDASTVFGLGATIAPLPISQTRLIARLSTKAGEHVRIADGPSLHERECRLGPRFDTGLSLHQFEVVLCVRVESPEHINVEEAKALLWYIRWLLRSGTRFGHRVVVLLDSRVVIGAVAKGRSSSTRLNRVIKQIAALCFVGGLVLHLVFIPTEHNPADHPSRGDVSTWPIALRTRAGKIKKPAQRPMSRLEAFEARIAKLAESDSYGNFCSSSSGCEDDFIGSVSCSSTSSSH